MRITESKLRRLIRQVIRENVDTESVEEEKEVNTGYNSKDMKDLHDQLSGFIDVKYAKEGLTFNNMFPHLGAYGDHFGIIFHQSSKSPKLKKILDEFEMDIKGRIKKFLENYGQEDTNFKHLKRVLKSYNHIKGDEKLAQYLKNIDKKYQS